MLIIPAIDLQNGKCVRLSQGRKDAAVVYDDDPVMVAQSFAQAGARMLHVVDLDAAFSNHSFPNRNVLRKIIEAIEIPVQFGGGLRSPDDIRQIIELGVMRAVIGTLAAESPETLKGLVQTFGRDHIAVGIDARDGDVMVRGWEQKGKIRAIELARTVAQTGVNRIIYTDVARDGMLTGANLEQTLLIARESGLKITASGGVSSLADIQRFNQLNGFGIDSVIIGKALYERRFTLEEALQASH
jgi:phosphoribosylformimino-5-aminoimidazole carboxamide ribotide isomerase